MHARLANVCLTAHLHGGKNPTAGTSWPTVHAKITVCGLYLLPIDYSMPLTLTTGRRRATVGGLDRRRRAKVVERFDPLRDESISPCG
jgi:hypothetical protein